MFANVSELIPTPDEVEVIRKLAWHYSDEIKFAVIGRGINGCEQLIELLEEFDKIGGTNYNTNESREWRNRAPNSNTQSNAWRAPNSGNGYARTRTNRPGSHGNGATPSATGGTQRSNVTPGPRQGTSPGGHRTPWENNSWRQQQQQPSSSQYRVQNLEIKHISKNYEVTYPTEEIPQETGNGQGPRQ